MVQGITSGKKTYGWIAVTAAVALCAGACGSASKSQATSSTVASSIGKLTGTPFVAEFVDNPETSADNLAGLTAATKAINTAGGVDGHPLVVNFCNDNNDAATAATCVRQAIANPSVKVFLDVESSYGSSYDSLIQQAGMANLGVSESSNADETNPSSFPLWAGTFDSIVGPYAAVVALGDKRVGVPYIGIPAGAELAPFIKQLISPLGGSVVGVESIPPTAADYTAFAAKEIAAKPDVVTDGLTNAMYESFIKAVQAQGGKLTYEISAGVLDAAQVQSQFGTSVNVILVNEFDVTAPAYQKFLSDVKKYNPSAPDTNDNALSGWVNVHAFAQVLTALAAAGDANPSRADITSYLNKQTDFSVEGLTDTFDYTKPAAGLGGTVPRLFSTQVWLGYARNGQEVPIAGGKAFSLPGWS